MEKLTNNNQIWNVGYKKGLDISENILKEYQEFSDGDSNVQNSDKESFIDSCFSKFYTADVVVEVNGIYWDRLQGLQYSELWEACELGLTTACTEIWDRYIGIENVEGNARKVA